MCRFARNSYQKCVSYHISDIKSVIHYEKLFQPAYLVRYSMLNLKQDGNLINIPLFLADKTKELLKDKSRKSLLKESVASLKNDDS